MTSNQPNPQMRPASFVVAAVVEGSYYVVAVVGVVMAVKAVVPIGSILEVVSSDSDPDLIPSLQIHSHSR